MKKINYLLLMMLILGMAACKKDNGIEGNDAMPVTISIKLVYDTESAAIGLALEKTAVKLTNLTTNQTYNAAAGIDGIAIFKDITPGNYNVAAVQTIAATEYNSKAGTSLTDAVIFNGTLSSQSLVQNGNLTVTLKTGRIGDWVIKQIYYSGSSASDGALFRDQFIEIFNNWSETLYADSL